MDRTAGTWYQKMRFFVQVQLRPVRSGSRRRGLERDATIAARVGVTDDKSFRGRAV